MILEPDKYFEY